MNEEALQHSYDLFKKDGYNGNIDDYKKLIEEDNDALEHSFGLFKSDGYDGKVEDFTELIATEPVKIEAVATEAAPVIAEEAVAMPSRTEMITGVKPEDMVSTSEEASLGLQDGEIEKEDDEDIIAKTERYVNYTVDGKEVVTFEDDYLDKVQGNPNALSFEDYAKSIDVNIVESPASVTIKTKGSDAIAQDILGADAYLKPQELSGFGEDGQQLTIENNREKIQQVSEQVNGINYLDQDDNELENLDVFATQNPEQKIVVYEEGTAGLNYRESRDNLFSIGKNLDKLKQKSTTYKGVNSDELKQIKELENSYDAAYDTHLDRFKTLKPNVMFITTQDSSKRRFDSQGEKIYNELTKSKDKKSVIDDYDKLGVAYLSPKELEIFRLTNELENPTTKNKEEIQDKLADLKDGMGEELYDPVTGDVYNLETGKAPPQELVASYKRSNELFAKNDLDYLKNLSLNKQAKLIGAAEDLYSILSDEDYVKEKGGFGAAKKFSLDSLKYIIENKKLPASLKSLEEILGKEGYKSSFYNLAPDLSDKFNKTLSDYLEVNRAIKTNTNILTSKEKEYFNEFLDSAVNKFGLDVDTKGERQEDMYSLLKESGFTDESVDELSEGVINTKTGEAVKNIGQVVARGVPDLAEFVVELTVLRGLSGNIVSKIGRFGQKAISKAFKGNKFVQSASETIIPALVEGAEFGAVTAGKNFITGSDESVIDSALSGFSMGIGGKLTRGFFSSLSKMVSKTPVAGKIADYSVVRGIGNSKVMNSAYKSFTSASGGAGAYISGGILLDPIDFEYNKIGRTYLEEGAKMFLLGKFQNGMKTRGKSFRKVYEDFQSDILSFSDLNPTSYKASKALNISTNIIKKPSKNSNQEVENAFIVKRNGITKRLLKKEITQDQANKEYKQAEGAKDAIQVQIGINQAKETINQSIKDGLSVSKGEQFVIGKRLNENGFEDLSIKQLESLSTMSPEAIVLNTSQEYNKENIELSKNIVDGASRINAILNGKTKYISSKKAEEVSTGTSPNEFRSPSKNLKEKTYQFLVEKESAEFTLTRLKKINKTNLSELEVKELDREIAAANFNFNLYTRDGKVYEELQSELRGGTFTELNKEYNKYIAETGEQAKVVRYSKAEDFAKSNVKASVNDIGYFDPKTGTRHINMEKAMNIKDITVIAHEDTHFILKDILKDEKGNITPDGKKVIETVLNSLKPIERKLLEEQFESRYEEDQQEEKLTLLVELIKKGEIIKNDGLKERILEAVPILRKNRFKNLKIDANTGDGIFDLLDGFARGQKEAIKAANKFAKKQAQTDKSKVDISKSSSSLEALKLELQEIDEFDYDNEFEFDQAVSNLESRISRLEKTEKATTKEEVVTKPKAKEVIEKASNKVFEKPEVSDKNKRIAKTNDDIINEMSELGANSISEIKDPAKKKAIIDKLGKNNLGAVTELTKKAAAIGKDLVIDENQKISYDEFFSGFSEELASLIKTYKVNVNGKKVPFGAYMNQNLRLRYGQILDKALKGRIKSSESLSSDKNVKKEVGSFAEETSSQATQVEESRVIDPRDSNIVKDKIDKVNEVVDLDMSTTSTLNFKNVGEKFGGKVASVVFDVPEGKISDTTKNLTYAKKIVNGIPEQSEAGRIQNSFTNPQQAKEFIKLLPEFNVAGNEVQVNETGEIIDASTSAKGYAIGVPNSLIKAMYEPYVDPKSKSLDKNERAGAITSPKGRSKGLTSQATVYRLKSEFRGNINNEAITKFQDLLGITKKGELNNYDRKIGQVLKSTAKLFGSELANVVVRDKISKSDFGSAKGKSQTLADIGAGKSSLMFSKSVEISEKDKKLIKNNLIKNTTRLKNKGDSLNPDIFIDSVSELIEESKNLTDILKGIEDLSKENLSEKSAKELSASIANDMLRFSSKDKQKAILASFDKYRQTLIKEYERYGLSIIYKDLKDKLSELKNTKNTRPQRQSLIKQFLYNVSRSAKSSKIEGLPSNIKIFEEFIEPIGGKELGFGVLKEGGKSFLTFKTEKGKPVKLEGMMDITDIKKRGFTDDVISRMSQESSSSIYHIIDLVKKYKGDINKIKSVLSISSIDQRSPMRKISKSGFEISGLNYKEKYLEHNPPVSSLKERVIDFAEGKITEQELIDYLSKARVNLISKELESLLSKKASDKNAVDRYEYEPFKSELDKNRDKIITSNIDDQYYPSVRFSKDLNKTFNEIIENKSGIKASDNVSEVKAKLLANSKRRFNIFVPPSAEDFVGLLYTTLGKGKTGDKQMDFYSKALLKPYARAMQSIRRDRLDLGRSFKEIKKQFNTTPQDLKKKIPDSLFNKEQAVRVFIWDSVGKEIPGLSKTETKELVDYVSNNQSLKEFANQVMRLNPGSKYTSPKDTWATGNITTDLLETMNESRRAKHLSRWQQNVDAMFSNDNLNKLEAAYGTKYRKAMENILTRMKTGRNRTYGSDSQTSKWIDWVNGSVGAIMFFNARSSVLQTLSMTNFINFKDNNIFAAGKAFANQKQYWSDFAKLINSDFLLDRRDSLKINVNEADIAEAAKEKGVRGAINYILKLGFTPTKFADSFAIAAGGSTFYRNRIKALIKQGMDPVAAEKVAMRDFIETAEESQQSSRPDKISQEQAGPLGRVVLAFANTPAQYTRIIKKSASDLVNRRGSDKENISKIVYYSTVQNLIFNALQQALFAISFGDEEEDELLSEKKLNIVNGMLDSVLRGSGVGGAVVSTVKNAALRMYKESEKDMPKYEKIASEVLKISPPISSKYGKIVSAGKTLSWDMKEIKKKGFDITSPAVKAGAQVVTAATNIPLDRVVKKVENLVAASDAELETYKRIALTLGWSKWELGIKEPKKKKNKGRRSTTRTTITR